MTAEELRTFVAAARVEIDGALARLATVDPDALPPDLREHYEAVRRGWEQLRALTSDEVLALHEEACRQAGRELTPEEMRGLRTLH